MTELTKGQTLGTRFRLLSRLGGGGMAEVWLATDSQRNQELALKIVSASLADSQESIDLLIAVCERTRRLFHPNIVRVYGHHAEADKHFISMEYVSGGTARDLRGREWHEIIKLLLPVADALDYAHSAGLVHRDVRAANILLDTAGKPRLVDFGVASILYPDSALPSTSPQQLAGEKPAVSDDVYAFGALLYDLVCGEPLFHPEASVEHIQQEAPQLLSSRCADIPPALDQLVGTLLQKQAERRPPGMAAVLHAMEAMLVDVETDSVTPSKPVSSHRGGENGADKAPAEGFRPRPLPKESAGSGRLLYASLALLGVIVLGVVFLLPGYVGNTVPLTPSADVVAEVEPVVATPEPEPVNVVARDMADAALADLLRVSDGLRAQAVERWGGAAWFAALKGSTEGDEFYKDRDYASATTAYRAALQLLQPLTARAAEVLQTALQDGQTAFMQGNQQLALQRFDLAKAITPNNLTAQQGYERALKLDLVMSLVNTAADFEYASSWPEALNKYAEALAVDSQWPAAVEGFARITGIIAGNDYQRAMSAGFTALNDGDYARARQHFESALDVRPADQDALIALEQIASEQRFARIKQLTAEASSFSEREDWSGAVRSYQAILSVDTSVVAAREGLAASLQREELDGRIQGAINSPDRLTDQAILQATRQLLGYAQSVESPGPLLTKQIASLERTVQRAVRPVNVVFQSDSQTEVVIYKVGRYAAFTTREIDLLPGMYTAVGVRSGYRDVRLQFRVQPETPMQPIVIRCEDPI